MRSGEGEGGHCHGLRDQRCLLAVCANSQSRLPSLLTLHKDEISKVFPFECALRFGMYNNSQRSGPSCPWEPK